MRLCSLAWLGFFSLLVLAPSVSRAESNTVPLKPGVDLRVARESLRMAVRAFEEESRRPLPDLWTPITLKRGRTVTLGSGLFLLLMKPAETGVPRVMFVDDKGPHEASMGIGQEASLGALRVILLSRTPDARQADVLVRAANPVPLLLTTEQASSPPSESGTHITALDHPKRIVIKTPSMRIENFAVAFLQGINNGMTAEDAARAARAAVPAHAPLQETGETSTNGPGSQEFGFRPPNNSPNKRHPPPPPSSHVPPPPPENQSFDLPQSALVTLYLVRGDSAALSSLSVSGEYRSDAKRKRPSSPEAKAGPRGGSLKTPHLGDPFQARLDVLAAARKIHIETRMFLRVPIGGRSHLTLNGPHGNATAWVGAQPRGRNRVQLDISQAGGDWSFLGSLSTSISVENGATILLAQNTSQRTETRRSGVPIVRGVPLIGPLFGSERTIRENSTYALYATVDLE